MPRDSLAEIEKHMRTCTAQLNRPAKRGEDPHPIMVSAAEASNVYFLRRPSGIMELDLHTGGGLPAGGLVYISGPDGAGKTFLLHKYFAMLQRLYGEKARIGYAMSEGAPDHLRMRATGVQVAVPNETIKAMNQARQECGEPPLTKAQEKELKTQVGEIKIIRAPTAEKLLDAIIVAVESKAFDIIALDSVSALMPESEASKGLDEYPQQAAAANALTRFFLHYLPTTTGFMGSNETTVFFVSQVRSNRKKSEAQASIAKYMRDWASQGAWAAKHGKLIDICVWSSSPEKQTQTQQVLGLGGTTTRREERVAVRKTMHWQILKGKAGTHDGITGEVDFHYDVPPFTDDYRDLILIAITKAVIVEKKGELTFYRGPEKQADPQFSAIPNIEQAIALLKSDFQLELAVRREVLATAGIRCLYS